MDLAAPPVVSGEAAAHGTGTSRLARTGFDSATGAGSTDEGGSADLTNPGRQVTRQVGAHLLRQLGVLDGRGTLRLTLNPEHLGRVEITFVRDGRDLNLTFRAEAAGSAEALRSGAGELQTLLLDKGGEWDRVAVRVESDEKPDDSDDAADSRQHREERDRSSEQEGTPS
jgi:flagellar hook-length control protein FliK